MLGTLSISLRCTCDVLAQYTTPCPQWYLFHQSLIGAGGLCCSVCTKIDHRQKGAFCAIFPQVLQWSLTVVTIARTPAVHWPQCTVIVGDHQQSPSIDCDFRRSPLTSDGRPRSSTVSTIDHCPLILGRLLDFGHWSFDRSSSHAAPTRQKINSNKWTIKWLLLGSVDSRNTSP